MTAFTERLRELEGKATKGRWRSYGRQGCKDIGAKSGSNRQAQYYSKLYTVGLSDEQEDAANADLVVLVRNALPTIIEALEAAKKLQSESLAILAVAKAAMREAAGHTNVNVFVARVADVEEKLRALDALVAPKETT